MKSETPQPAAAQPLKVYIAAPFPIRDRAVSVMHVLELKGIEVTSRWLKAPDTMTDEHARKDLDDVAAADVLLALNPDGWEERGTGGRHVELGYALALGKPVLLVGERSNIFHHLACVTQIDEIADFTKHLKRLAEVQPPAAAPLQDLAYDVRMMTDKQLADVLSSRAALDANQEFGRWLGRLLTAWVTDSPLADIDAIIAERAALIPRSCPEHQRLTADELYRVMQAWEGQPASEEQTRIVIKLGALREGAVRAGDSPFVTPLDQPIPQPLQPAAAPPHPFAVGTEARYQHDIETRDMVISSLNEKLARLQRPAAPQETDMQIVEDMLAAAELCAEMSQCEDRELRDAWKSRYKRFRAYADRSIRPAPSNGQLHYFEFPVAACGNDEGPFTTLIRNVTCEACWQSLRGLPAAAAPPNTNVSAASVAAEFRQSEREALNTAQQIEKRMRIGMEFDGDRVLAAHYRKNAKYYGDRAAAIEAVIQVAPAAAQPATDLMDVLQRASEFDDLLGRVQMYGAADRVRDSWNRLKDAILEAHRSLHPPASAVQPETLLLDALKRQKAMAENVIGFGGSTELDDRYFRGKADGIQQVIDSITYEQQRQPPASAVSPTQPEWIEHRLRQEWWTGHGCSFASLYGDDGEMQCNAMTCRKDFKRDSMESLRQHVEARRLAAYADSQSSAVSPREEPKTLFSPVLTRDAVGRACGVEMQPDAMGSYVHISDWEKRALPDFRAASVPLSPEGPSLLSVADFIETCQRSPDGQEQPSVELTAIRKLCREAGMTEESTSEEWFAVYCDGEACAAYPREQQAQVYASGFAKPCEIRRLGSPHPPSEERK